MFGNLKSKIGDVADLKKLASPQAISGSRQRSRQHTPGTQTPNLQHSRQSSVASLQGLGLPSSPPLSPTDHDRSAHNHERELELEREVGKLRSALETQQDAALERLNAKEQEWRGRLQQERDKVGTLTQNLEQARNREKKLQEKVDSVNGTTKQTSDQLKNAQDLEGRVCEMQDNYDQLEGLNAQEVAKIKHMLLNTNNELEEARAELAKKTATLSTVESRLGWAAGLEDRVALLSEEKTELETQVAGLTHKLNQTNARYNSAEEAQREELEHLRSRVNTLEQRHSQAALQETDKVQALIKEREMVEHALEEARQQLNNIKASWSDKITALENQISHLNDKMAEDQADLQEAEEKNRTLTTENSTLKEEKVSMQSEMQLLEKKLHAEMSQVKEDLETSQWQLKSTVSEKDEQIKTLQDKLTREEEKHHSCATALQCKLETVASLEHKIMEVESNLEVTNKSLTDAREGLLRAQTEKQHLQETLLQERNTIEALEKGKSEYQSKLEVVSGEKARLSRNLDEYADRVNKLEDTVQMLQNDVDTRTSCITRLESNLANTECECRELKERLNYSEEDLQQRIESSNVVQTLRDTVKSLEDELSEKKQALKVQGQRLADMKKTIQRELKLSAEATESVTPAAATLPTMATTVDLHEDSRLSDSLRAINGSVSATNGRENGNNVNLTYLKHVIIKYLTSREYEAVHLTRAVATLLMMTPEEERLLRETLEWKMSWFGSKPNLGKGQEALTIPPSQ